MQQALQNARVLAANQEEGGPSHSPWPFRADYRSGEGRGPVSGNMTYVLRLYDALLEQGYEEFSAPRESLWKWIRDCQIPSAAGDGRLFAQFFEDHDTPTNRTAWAPLNLARYLLEKRDAIDSEWREDAGTLIEFVRRHVHSCGVRDSRLPRAGRGQASLGRHQFHLRGGACPVREGDRIGNPGGRSPRGAQFHALFDRRQGPAHAIYSRVPYPAAGRKMLTRTSSTTTLTPCALFPEWSGSNT